MLHTWKNAHVGQVWHVLVCVGMYEQYKKCDIEKYEGDWDTMHHAYIFGGERAEFVELHSLARADKNTTISFVSRGVTR